MSKVGKRKNGKNISVLRCVVTTAAHCLCEHSFKMPESFGAEKLNRFKFSDILHKMTT